MPKLNDMFPSKWLKAADFDESGSVLTIDRLEEESIGQGSDKADKWVLYFKELDKGLVLNKTNTNIIAALYGDDTDEWDGKLVTLYATEVQFQGDMVDAIRVRKKAPKPKKATATTKPTASAPTSNGDDVDSDDDDVEAPF
jgi:hypothetical protein